MKRLVGVLALLVVLGLAFVAMARRHNGIETWAKEPQQFMGIILGQPISKSLPLCQSADDRHPCFNAEYATADNITDTYGLVQIVSKHDQVQRIMLTLSKENVDLAYKDLAERFGKPTVNPSPTSATWIGKHVSIDFSRPNDTKIGWIIVSDSDVKDDPVPAHKNAF